MGKIIITYDDSCEMLRIENGTDCIFEGNEMDFERDAKNIKKFLEDCGLSVDIMEIPYEEWEYE